MLFTSKDQIKSNCFIDIRPEVAEEPEVAPKVQTTPHQPKFRPVSSTEENFRPEAAEVIQKPEKFVNIRTEAPEAAEIVRKVATMPRQPKIRPTPSSEENILAGSAAGSGTSANRFRSTLATTVGRSQSFQLPDKTTTPRRMGPQLSFKLGGASFRNADSKGGVNPLYKSTSHLNRMNSGVLKSPGIVTSISKSQLDLNKSSSGTEPFRPEANTFYTLPRKRVDPIHPASKFIQRPDSPDFQPPPPPPVASSPIPDNDAESFSFPPPPPSLPTLPVLPASPSELAGRGESFSSIHRRKLEAAKQVIAIF